MGQTLKNMKRDGYRSRWFEILGFWNCFYEDSRSNIPFDRVMKVAVALFDCACRALCAFSAMFGQKLSEVLIVAIHYNFKGSIIQ